MDLAAGSGMTWQLSIIGCPKVVMEMDEWEHEGVLLAVSPKAAAVQHEQSIQIQVGLFYSVNHDFLRLAPNFF